MQNKPEYCKIMACCLVHQLIFSSPQLHICPNNIKKYKFHLQIDDLLDQFYSKKHKDVFKIFLLNPNDKRNA